MKNNLAICTWSDAYILQPVSLNKINKLLKIKILQRIIIICTLFNYSIYAQTIVDLKSDTLNQHDSNKKKNGFWIEYVNQNLEPVKKIKKAIFFRFVYFEHGFQLDNFNHHITCKKVALKINGNLPINEKIILLDGEYKICDKKGRVAYTEIYNKRKKSILKCHSINTDKLNEYVDYNIKYNNQEHSFYILSDEMSSGEFKQKAFYRKGDKGWRIYDEH